MHAFTQEIAPRPDLGWSDLTECEAIPNDVLDTRIPGVLGALANQDGRERK
jgi:hypothetical protein